MKDFGHQSWAIKHTDSISSKPTTLQPILPDQEQFLGKPAASEVKTFVQRRGRQGGLQIGIHAATKVLNKIYS
jgi:hypothetical protein